MSPSLQNGMVEDRKWQTLGDKCDYIYVCQKFQQIFSVKEQNMVMLSEYCDKTCK